MNFTVLKNIECLTWNQILNGIYFLDDEDGSGISGTDVSGESDQENVQFDEDGNKIKKKKKKKKKKGKKGGDLYTFPII